jgi:hypothetical protein
MGAKIKPVQPTAIKYKTIIEQIIHEIHRRPSKAQLVKMKRQDRIIMSMVKR